MKVVVTGGSGQLGTLVLERLVGERKVKKIISLDLTPPVVPSPRIDWRIADMRDPGLERHLEDADALVHLAFLVTKAASVKKMRAVNVEGSQRLFEGAAQHGVKKIVYSSSVAAYGVAPGLPDPVVENTPRQRAGNLTYADNKWEVEEFLDVFESTHPGVAVVRLRPGVLLGRRVAHFGRRLLAERILPIAGDGRGPIVWDEDVADAVVLGLTRDVHGAFNLAARHSLTTTEFAAVAGFRTVSLPRAVVNGAVRSATLLGPMLRERRLDPGWIATQQVDMVVSAERARDILGWKPRLSEAADVAAEFGRVARRKPDFRVSAFASAVPRLAKQAKEGGHLSKEVLALALVIHLDVVGPDGGDYTLRMTDGDLTAKSGVPRPPDSAVTLDTATLLELLSGKTDLSTASVAGKVRVRGEPLAGLVLGGVVAAFREASRAEGARGKIASRFSRWFGEGNK